MITNLHQFLIKTVFELSLSSSLAACTFRTMILHQQTLRPRHNILLVTNSILLTADTILWCTKNPVSN